MSKIFDSHCHPQFPQYDADRDEMIKRNLEKGVFMIAAGASLETSRQAIELANRYDGIWATVGLHPDEVSDDFNIEDYKTLASEKKVVAIGEVGLDYFRTPEEEKRTKQKEVFAQFIDLSLEIKKPLVLHCRSEKNGPDRSGQSAHEDAIQILKTVNSKLETENLPLRGVVHSFTGTTEEAQAYLKLGFLLAFNGIITFSEEFDELIKSLPLDKILLETDAPWLTPAPNRGKRNEPSGVFEVAKKIAELKNEALEKVIDQTNQNCINIFRL